MIGYRELCRQTLFAVKCGSVDDEPAWQREENGEGRHDKISYRSGVKNITLGEDSEKVE